jgi:lysyl-tRNA synthetase class 1
VIKIYDEYDMLEEKYYDGAATPQERRIYELSQVRKSKERKEKFGFRHLITLVQVGKAEGERANKVRAWLEKYSPEEFKFEVAGKVSATLDKKQKQALVALKESLSVKDFTEDELFNEFYNISEAVGITNKEFFEGAYMAIIGKVKGPRLASLILAVGKEKIVKLLKQIR